MDGNGALAGTLSSFFLSLIAYTKTTLTADVTCGYVFTLIPVFASSVLCPIDCSFGFETFSDVRTKYGKMEGKDGKGTKREKQYVWILLGFYNLRNTPLMRMR